MEKIIYRDKAGNRIYQRFIKTRDTWQFYAKNRQGRIINPKGFNELAKESGIKFPRIKKAGIFRSK